MLNVANISVKTKNGKQYHFIHSNSESYISFCDGTALRYKLLSCGPIAVGHELRGSYFVINDFGENVEIKLESDSVEEIVVNL